MPSSADALKTSVDDAANPAGRTARVRVLGRAPSSLQVQSAAGSAPAPPALEHDGDTEVDVVIGTQLNVLRTAVEPAFTLRHADKRPFSGKILVGTRNVRTGRATAWRFQPVVLAKIVPLQWDPIAKGYLTTIEVGLDSEEPDARLLTPVTFEGNRSGP